MLMNEIIENFSLLISIFGYTYKRRKLEDGAWLHYAEKSMGSWSKIINYWDYAEELSLSAGLNVPMIDQTVDLLFPLKLPRGKMEHRIFRTAKINPKNTDLEIWFKNSISECVFNLENFKKPGDLALFFAISASRKKTLNIDWNNVMKPWIAINYLKGGKETARLAIKEEILYSKKFDLSLIADYLFQILFLHRKPRNLYPVLKDLNNALLKLENLEIFLPEYEATDFDYPKVIVEREGSH
jgi:hypothetical protein